MWRIEAPCALLPLKSCGSGIDMIPVKVPTASRILREMHLAKSTHCYDIKYAINAPLVLGLYRTFQGQKEHY
jgi:hypothetical protein